MPQLRFVTCPSSVRTGAPFSVDVVVENSLGGQHVQLQLRRIDTAEAPGSWDAVAVIAADGRGPARFTGVVLHHLGQATLKCSSTSHLVIPAATTVRVDP